MKQSNLDEFAYRTQLGGLSEKGLKILKVLNRKDPNRNGLKARQIAGEILEPEVGRGGPRYRSGRKIKRELETLREKDFVRAFGSKSMDWKITEKGRESWNRKKNEIQSID